MTQSPQPQNSLQSPESLQSQESFAKVIELKLKEINKLLAPGISATCGIDGIVRYSVRVSKSGIGGQSTKLSLGTFIDYGLAVSALVEFKVKGHLSTFPHELVRNLIQDFQAQESAEVQALKKLQESHKSLAAQVSLSEATQEIKQEQTDAFAILNASDFMLIRAGHPFHYTADNGESRTIPAAVVDAWFKQFS